MPQSVIDSHQRTNFFQTLWLLLAMTAVMGIAGFLLFGVTGMVIAFVLLLVGAFFSQQMSATMILRAYRAKRIQPENAPALFQVMDQICGKAGIPIPPLYYIPSRMPNAFAAGIGRESFIAMTDGLLRGLSRRELTGVLAHEVAHIINHDIRVLGMADLITRTTAALARMGLFLMIFSVAMPFFGMNFLWYLMAGLVLFGAPVILVLLQLAISRTREFDADLGAAELTGDPMGLAMALQKINPAEAMGVVERIFRPGPKRSQPAMLRTHPPTEERIERLMQLEKIQHAERIAAAEPETVQPFLIGMPPVNRKPRYHPTNGMWY